MYTVLPQGKFYGSYLLLYSGFDDGTVLTLISQGPFLVFRKSPFLSVLPMMVYDSLYFTGVYSGLLSVSVSHYLGPLPIGVFTTEVIGPNTSVLP